MSSSSGPHGTMAVVNPVVGRLELAWETLRAPGEDDQALVVCCAQPGSESEAGLRLLASWISDADSGPDRSPSTHPERA